MASAPAGDAPPRQQEARRTIASATVTVDLSAAPRSPIVLIEYRLPEGSGAMPFRILQSPAAEVEFPSTGGGGPALSIERFDDSQVAGTVALTAGGPGQTRVTLRYTVIQRGPEGLYSLPLPVPEWPPGQAAGDAFVATVLVPEGSVLRDPFPSHATAPKGDGRAYTFALPAVPSQLAFELRPRGAGGPGVGRWIDVATALLLAALTLVGWRRLRRDLA